MLLFRLWWTPKNWETMTAVPRALNSERLEAASPALACSTITARGAVLHLCCWEQRAVL